MNDCSKPPWDFFWASGCGILWSTAVAGVELRTKEIQGSPANIARAEGVLELPVDKLLPQVASVDGEHFKAQDDELLDWKVLKTIDDANAIVYSGHKCPFPVTNRELLYVRTVHKLDDGRTLVVGASINDKDQNVVDGRVRAVVLACWLFAPQDGGKTHVTRVIQLDPKGSVPGFLINAQQAKAATAISILQKFASK